MSVHTSSRIRTFVAASAAVMLVGLSGCATTNAGDTAAMQGQIDSASADASSAKADAAAARSTAAEALRVANEAKAIAEETEEKIDRMFKKAMHK